jgi:protein TonB
MKTQFLKFLLFFGIILFSQNGYSQTVENNDTDFTFAEVQAEFKGGENALREFLQNEIRYPFEAQKKGIQGRVTCGFIVLKDGSISDITVIKSSGNTLLDNEALRVVKKMPKWKPAIQDGKPVNCRFTLPVVFKLR